MTVTFLVFSSLQFIPYLNCFPLQFSDFDCISFFKLTYMINNVAVVY